LPPRQASEDRLLAWLRGEIGRGGRSLLGDDAALLPRGAWAVTVDSQIAGVHFDADLDPALLARRLLAVNLSDLAAVGALPAYAFLALSGAPGFDHRRFFRALLAACRRRGLTLAGGDLATHPSATTATLTLLGRRRPGGRWLARASARPGDALWLGGTVGESAAGRALLDAGARRSGAAVRLPPGWRDAPPGLAAAARRAVRRHLLPAPQLELSGWLARRRRAAAIDVSDGVALDLRRLCRESAVGAAVTASELPFAAGFVPLCERLGRDPLALALGGGEDYVLLFALPPGARPPERLGCRRIGEIESGRRLSLVDQGRRRALPAIGWDHLQQGRPRGNELIMSNENAPPGRRGAQGTAGRRRP
jgi:thiamine-monophosphate kinase